jgi:hypothetical protein
VAGRGEDIGMRKRAWVAASLLVLVPCFWQARIQAGDFSSHLYNAWLAQLVERGQAPGLSLAKQSSNILFDLLLSGLLRMFGPGPAQLIAVSLAVLVFFWGAFAFVWSGSRRWPRRPPWHLGLCLAMLAYGWVFHMGLFNFYIALGLSFGALALARKRKAWAMAAAVSLLGIAYLAHGLPVGWAGGILVYEWVARAMRPRRRIWLLAGALVAMGGLAAILVARFAAEWTAGQVTAVSGADQLWVFGVHYVPLAAGLLAIWTLWFLRMSEARGVVRTVLDVRFQLCFLCAASVVIIPGSVWFPGMHNTLNLIGERMSLATAIMFCAWAASLRPRRGEMAGLAIIAALFFGCIYADQRALNRLETRMGQLLEQIPPGQRVISVLADPNSRTNSLAHLVDRICIGRCFSYANYEPSTAQFRVRANRRNPIVIADYIQSWQMQLGGYTVRPRDLPVYKIDLCQTNRSSLCITPLEAGTVLKDTWLRAGPVLGKWDNRPEPH